MFTIETQRLLLRKIAPGDAEDLFEILSDDQTCLDDGGFHAKATMDQEFCDWVVSIQSARRYAVVLKEENKCIGMLHLQNEERAVPAYELGMVLNKAYRRKGYMFEAVSVLMEAWFSRMDVEMFTARHFPHNEASRNLIHKLGFVYEGVEHNAMNHAVLGPVDLICYYKEKEK